MMLQLLSCPLDTVKIIFVISLSFATSFDLKDETHYEINFRDDGKKQGENANISIQTLLGEAYGCYISNINETSRYTVNIQSETKDELGALHDLMSHRPCVTLAEIYWTYELCHLKNIRQFHEEMHLEKNSNLQEFILGIYNTNTQLDLSSSRNQEKVALGGYEFWSFPVYYEGGTVCDLTGFGRRATVFYICAENVVGEIIEVSEIESCQYRIVLASSYFCSVPGYKVQRPNFNYISCYPAESTQVKPKHLINLEWERKNIVSSIYSDITGLIKHLGLQSYAASKQGDRSRSDATVAVGSRDAVDTWRNSATIAGAAVSPSAVSKAAQAMSRKQVEDFLAGRQCLDGDTGSWWTHEICFNGQIHQFHRVTGSVTQQILLGQWNEEAHRNWLAKHPSHRPLSDADARKFITLYYGDGSYCDEIAAPRHVIVKLRCLPSASTSIHFSFSEPSACSYSFLVESALFCDVLKYSDQDGILRYSPH